MCDGSGRGVPHRGAVGVHVAQLWDGVLGVDGDDNLRRRLMPVESARDNFLPLRGHFQIGNNR